MGLRTYGEYLFEKEHDKLLAQLKSPSSIQLASFEPVPIGNSKILNAYRTGPEPHFQVQQTDFTLPPRARDFVDDPVINSAQLSPSGRYVGVVQVVDGKSYAVIYDTQSDTPPQVLSFSIFNIEWINWASDDRLLIGYSLLLALELADMTFLIGGARVMAIDRDGSNSVVLFDGEPAVAEQNFLLSSISHLLPEDPAHVIMPAFNNNRLGLWRVNVDTGAAELIQNGNTRTGGWFVNSQGRAAIRIDTNNRGTYLWLYAQNPVTNKWKEISSGQYAINSAPNIWPIASSKNPNFIYVLANKEDEDRISIKLLDLSTGELQDTIFAHDKVDVSGALMETGTGQFLGSWFIEDNVDVQFEDADMQNHYQALRNFFGGSANIIIINTSQAGSRFLLYISGPQDPGDYYIYDYNQKQITPLFATRPNLNRDFLSKVETINYQSRDGLSLTAYLTHPYYISDDPAPLIVIPHGGPEVRDSVSYNPYVQFLASRGYRVLQPNFRGSSGYGKEFAQAGHREWGRKMQDDISDAMLHVIDLGLVDDGKICIYGGSYGGYAALVGAMRSIDQYRCAISQAGVFDLLLFLQGERKEEGANSKSYKYWVDAIGHPKNDKAVLTEISPLHNAEKINIPVMLVHGEADNIVPIEQSQLMRDALKRHGKSVRYIEYPKTGHSGWSTDTKVAFLTELDIFLEKNIGRPYTNATIELETPPSSEAAEE